MSAPLPPLLVVVGPTASGKSALASLLAQKLSGEIISADSVQVYRYFDIGAGKPSSEELARAPHHLLGVAEPLEPMEAAVWAKMAARKVEEIRSRGNLPIVCGGTFLWVRALIFGLAEAPPGDPAIRAAHERHAAEFGRPSLHQRLRDVDEKSAERLHPNDFVRVSRALEVYELAGRPLSEIQEEHGFKQPRYRAHLLTVGWEHDEYEARLAARVRQMIRDGFRAEVEELLRRGYADARAMDAVGYRQVKEAIKSEGDSLSDEDLALQVTRVTRVFARRQRTWLRGEEIQVVPGAVLGSDAKLSVLADDIRRSFVMKSA